MKNGGKSMAEKCVRVRVPGTSANCGPGFDCLGLACTVYNDLELRLTREPGLSITMTGEGATNIPCDNRNIVWRSAQYLLEKAGKDKEYRGAVIHMENRVPLSRGLGSSATAIVAGLTAANALIGNPFNRREILQFATNIEGHPDNVAPAIFGGFTVNAVTNGRVDCFSFLPRFRMKFVVAVPNFPLSTRMARKVLPTEVPMKDAIFNIGRASMLVAALTRGNERYLRLGLDDALHQPYRASLMEPSWALIEKMRSHGFASTVSGAGPCVLVLHHGDAHEELERIAAEELASGHWRVLHLAVDTKGVQVERV